jgi:hypothetical protein
MLSKIDHDGGHLVTVAIEDETAIEEGPTNEDETAVEVVEGG